LISVRLVLKLNIKRLEDTNLLALFDLSSHILIFYLLHVLNVGSQCRTLNPKTYYINLKTYYINLKTYYINLKTYYTKINTCISMTYKINEFLGLNNCIVLYHFLNF
jgi:hypothetical protein